MNGESLRCQYFESITRQTNSELTAKAFSSFWALVENAEARYGKKIEDFTEESDLLLLVGALNPTTVPLFNRYKHYLQKYVQYLLEHDRINNTIVSKLSSLAFEDIDLSKPIKKKFFKDFDALQDTIDEMLSNSDRRNNDYFATHLCIIYLAWCCVQCEDAIDILKSDVYEDRIVVAGAEIFPNEQILRHLNKYKDMESYEVITHTFADDRGAVTRKYAPSKYLLRTLRRAHFDKADELRRHLTELSKLPESQGLTNFKYEAILQSGIYNRAYAYELTHGSIKVREYDKIERAFGLPPIGDSTEDRTKVNRMLRGYWAFKRHYYPST